MLTFDISILFQHWDSFTEGFVNTLEASIIALIGSFLLGSLIAILRIAPLPLLNWIGTIYVELIRNIPLLIVVLFFYLGLPSLGIPLDGFVSGTLGLTIYTASFIAESIRAGIQSVPKGQFEASRSSGLSYNQTMLYIIMPQAFKIVLPAMGNQFINLVKNSSVLAIVAGLDLMYFSDLVNARTFMPITVYAFTAIFYLVLTIPLNFLVLYMERHLAKAS